MWWTKYIVWLWTCSLVWAVVAEEKKNGGRLKEVEREILDIVGNCSSSTANLKEVLDLMHTSTGQHLGRLVLEGVMLVAQKKDSLSLLFQFWANLQPRLSPRLLHQLENYRDFFGGFDWMTLPLVWEQIFKKDQLGNSLAALPLGQLVNMVQPTATKYGIDIRAFVNSFLGHGVDNARDLVIEAVSELDWSNMLTRFMNFTSGAFADSIKGQEKDNPLYVIIRRLASFDLFKLIDKLNYTARTYNSSRAMLKEKSFLVFLETMTDVAFKVGLIPVSTSSEDMKNPEYSGKTDSDKKKYDKETIRLLRPLLTSLLRKNNIDLEPDAVLEVMVPFLSRARSLREHSTFGGQGSRDGEKVKKGDVMAQIFPLLSAFGGLLSGDGEQEKKDMMAQILPLLSAFGGSGGKGGQKEKQRSIMDLILPLVSVFGDQGKKDGKQGTNDMMARILSVFSAYAGQGNEKNKNKTGGLREKPEENTKSGDGLEGKRDEKGKPGDGLDANLANLIEKNEHTMSRNGVEGERDGDGKTVDLDRKLGENKKATDLDKSTASGDQFAEENKIMKSTDGWERKLDGDVESNNMDLLNFLSIGDLLDRNTEKLRSKLEAAAKSLHPGKRLSKEKPCASVKKPDSKSMGSKKEQIYLIDILKSILLMMHKDGQCNRKLRVCVRACKKTVNHFIPTLGDPEQLWRQWVSKNVDQKMLAEGGLEDTIVSYFQTIMKFMTWEVILGTFEEEDLKERAVSKALPHISSMLFIISSPRVQERLYQIAVPKLQAHYASLGLPALNLHNFPERLGPLLGLMGHQWNLPFNPTTLLVPLRDYIKATLQWITEELDEIKDLGPQQVEQKAANWIKDILQGLISMPKVARDGKVECLRERLCQLQHWKGLNEAGGTVMRYTSLVVMGASALKKPECDKLLRIVQAISDSNKDCWGTIREECMTEEVKVEEEKYYRNLFSNHIEL